ncbi:PKD domain-containing protein [bacterium]|nr:PKD domain-containing protein [bacterium]
MLTEPAVQDPVSLPAVGELSRDPAELINWQDSMLYGMDYCPDLPHANVLDSEDSTALMMQAGYDQPGMAFALFQMYGERVNAGEPAYDPIVSVYIDSEQPVEDLFFLFANYESGRWDLVPLEEGGVPGIYQAQFGEWNRYINAFGVMTPGVLTFSEGGFLLEQLQFGSAFRPRIRTEYDQNTTHGLSAEVEAIAYVYADDDPAYQGIASVGFDFNDDGVAEVMAEEFNKDQYIAVEGWTVPGPGVYTPRIIVISGSGDRFEKHIDRIYLGQSGSVEAVPDMVLGNGFQGRAGYPVRLDASGSTAGDSVIVHYNWYVDDKPLADSSEPVSFWTFDNPGLYKVGLQVVDANFNAPLIERNLMISADSRAWQSSVVTGLSEQQFEKNRGLAAVAGHPAILTRSGGNDDEIQYLRALDPSGSQWPAEASVVNQGVNGPGLDFLPLGLLEREGSPLAFFLGYSPDSEMSTIYMREGTDADGGGWMSPVVCFASGEGIDSDSLECTLVDGIPALVFRVMLAEEGWHYCSATSADALQWNPAVPLPGLTNSVRGKRVCLLDWAGNPCIAWSQREGGEVDRLCFQRALDIAGSEWDARVVAYEDSASVQLLDMALIGGQPALAFVSRQQDCLDRFDRLGYVRSHDTEGKQWSAPSFTGFSISENTGMLMELDGLPAIVALGQPYARPAPYMFISVARTAAGTSWSPPLALPRSVDLARFAEPGFHYSRTALSVDGVPTVLIKVNGNAVLNATLQ